MLRITPIEEEICLRCFLVSPCDPCPVVNCADA